MSIDITRVPSQSLFSTQESGSLTTMESSQGASPLASRMLIAGGEQANTLAKDASSSPASINQVLQNMIQLLSSIVEIIGMLAQNLMQKFGGQEPAQLEKENATAASPISTSDSASGASSAAAASSSKEAAQSAASSASAPTAAAPNAESASSQLSKATTDSVATAKTKGGDTSEGFWSSFTKSISDAVSATLDTEVGKLATKLTKKATSLVSKAFTKKFATTVYKSVKKTVVKTIPKLITGLFK